jgi:dGTPase
VGELFRAVRERYPGIERRRWIHEVIRRMINAMVDDLLAETRARLDRVDPKGADDIRAADGPVVAFSPDMVETDRALRAFLMRRMYRHYQVNRETAKARRVVSELFGAFMDRPNMLPGEWQAGDDGQEGQALRARRIADYIAGMTDRYALVEHARLFDLKSRF